MAWHAKIWPGIAREAMTWHGMARGHPVQMNKKNANGPHGAVPNKSGGTYEEQFY